MSFSHTLTNSVSHRASAEAENPVGLTGCRAIFPGCRRPEPSLEVPQFISHHKPTIQSHLSLTSSYHLQDPRSLWQGLLWALHGLKGSCLIPTVALAQNRIFCLEHISFSQIKGNVVLVPSALVFSGTQVHHREAFGTYLVWNR